MVKPPCCLFLPIVKANSVPSEKTLFLAQKGVFCENVLQILIFFGEF